MTRLSVMQQGADVSFSAAEVALVTVLLTAVCGALGLLFRALMAAKDTYARTLEAALDKERHAHETTRQQGQARLEREQESHDKTRVFLMEALKVGNRAVNTLTGKEPPP